LYLIIGMFFNFNINYHQTAAQLFLVQKQTN